MPIPTEPGWYWHVPARGAAWECAPVRMMGGKLRHGLPPWPPLESGEWGPRIPEPERLAAINEILETPHFDGEYGYCIFCCGADENYGDIAHDPNCPWQRAQEKRDG